ncbi:tRNA(Ile)-lysidine synthase TilS/MesJ [Desulfitispora alkaliphila]|uniref:tRNA 2-thiocytidine biosynthesis TtcA family protein n=1 Tax=Desulfitispora alkaliphila TaxID=622674 RepID=UPI003D1B8184
MNLDLTKADKQWFMTPVKKHVSLYKMIEPGDRIAVGLSGGKDSSVLFYILTQLQRQLPFDFELVPLTLTMGFEGVDISPLENYVAALGNELQIKHTLIGKIIFEEREEKNPCSLCANMRRGAMYNFAKALGCNKAALGHHLDDAVETFFMNMIFNGKMGTFQPKTYLDRRDITLIRPMLALEEETITKVVAKKGIPVVTNPCPANKKTKREEMKHLVSSLSKSYPDIRYKFLTAIKTAEFRNFWRPEDYR